MPRVVVPGFFVLRLGTLVEAHAAGRVADVYAKLGPLLQKRKHKTGEPGVPVSLRWLTNPILGFPRQPFEVWWRARKEEPSSAILGGASPVAPTTAAFVSEAIEVRFDAQPTGGQTLVVEAVSSDHRTIPGQRLQFTANESGRFRAAGIAGLKLTGAGQISGVRALLQTAWANLSDWERIELVGFPFETTEIPATAYEPSPQGWEPASMSGPDAALLRLEMGQLLSLDPPPVGGGLNAPPWPSPDPGLFLDALRKGPLADVNDCLQWSDDTDPAKLQANHVVDRSLPGLRQPGQSPGTTSADLSLTTTKYVALAANDSPVALGMGFGTYDIPQIARFVPKPDRMPPGTELAPDEYLVTAKYVFPGGIDLELAAIGHREAAPIPLTDVRAEETFANRATQRDGEESIAVRVSWACPALAAGEGLLSRRAAGATNVIDSPRPNGAGGFEPYLTEQRFGDDGDPAVDVRPGVGVPEEPVPRSGSTVTTYAVAPIDVHARWGPWRLVNHTASARPVQQPGLHDVAVALPSPLPNTAPTAGDCTLTVELSWDWADRSPDHIEVHGAFVPVGPPPATVTGFQSAVGATAGAPVVIAFNATTGAPSVTAPATVAEVPDPVMATTPPPSTVANDVRRYRLRVPGLTASFGGTDQLGYAVALVGYETVRNTEPSAPVGPRATTVIDPFPAPPPSMPAVDVLWTALPDASGRARTVLSWPAVPGAVGYTVWEATEAALFHAVSGGADSPVGQTLRTRAGDLKTRVGANQDQSLEAFSRLNDRPLTATSIELSLPGSADTLFVYRVSSITAQNVESARSADIVLVGVPNRDVPGTPHLEARGDSATGNVTLTVVAGSGAQPDTLRIHRCRREQLATDVGTMGPPVLGPVAVSTLTSVVVPSASGGGTSGWQLVDTVDPSWLPYQYRCVATGRSAPDDGVYPADSPASGTARVVVVPPAPPLVTSTSRTNGSAGALLSFETDLPWAPSPLGRATITISVVTTGGASASRSVVATFASDEIPVDAALVATGSAVTTPKATRRAAVDGVAEVTILLPAITSGSVVLTATDPIGRPTGVEIS